MKRKNLGKAFKIAILWIINIIDTEKVLTIKEGKKYPSMYCYLYTNLVQIWIYNKETGKIYKKIKMR